jgi:hypothetical protein
LALVPLGVLLKTELRINPETLPIAVIVLPARTNRLADLRPLVPALLAAINQVRPGTLQFVADDR